MKTAKDCFVEAQKALNQAFETAEDNAEASGQYREIAVAWLQMAHIADNLDELTS